MIVYVGNQEKGETQERWSKVLRRSSFGIYRYYNGLESLSHWRMFSIGETVRQRKDCDQLISQLVHLRFSVVMIDQRSLTQSHQYSV